MIRSELVMKLLVYVLSWFGTIKKIARVEVHHDLILVLEVKWRRILTVCPIFPHSYAFSKLLNN